MATVRQSADDPVTLEELLHGQLALFETMQHSLVFLATELVELGEKVDELLERVDGKARD